MSIDFSSIKHTLRPCIETIVKNLYPSGKKVGTEYRVGSIYGEPGDSMSINLETGVWKDFAEDGTGGSDIIALYATLRNLNMADAAKRLVESYAPEGIKYLNGHATKTTASIISPAPKPVEPTDTQFIMAPLNTELPNLRHSKYGEPTAVYKYQNKDSLIGLVTRYDLPNSKKEFRPWSINTDCEWIPRAWKQDSPLYAQERWSTKEKFIITEGEKCVDALYILLPNVSITTWQGGVNGLNRADLSPLYSAKKIVLWPDNDEPGIKCMNTLANKIHTKNPECEILIINTLDRPTKWDAADFVAESGTVTDFKNLVQSARKWEPAKTAELVNDNNKTKVNDDVPLEAVEFVDTWVKNGIRFNKQLSVTKDMDNIANSIQKCTPYADIYYNELDGETYINGERCEDKHIFEICGYLIKNVGIYSLRKETVSDAIKLLSGKITKNPLLEWLNTLKWDGTQRVENFFRDYTLAGDTDYLRQVSKMLFVALVARAYKPGCTVDTMFVFEGKQHAGKSTLMKLITGHDQGDKLLSKRVLDLKISAEHKDFQQTIQGAWVVEFGEMKDFDKQNINLIKQILSMKEDVYRLPYGERVIYRPRRCLFIGTSNTKDYLSDKTGNRRFIPIDMGDKPHSLKINEIIRDREQLLAEAICLMNSGFDWTILPPEIHTENDKRVHYDYYEDKLIEMLTDENKQMLREITKDFKTNIIVFSDIIKYLIDQDVLNLHEANRASIKKNIKLVLEKNNFSWSGHTVWCPFRRASIKGFLLPEDILRKVTIRYAESDL